MATTRPTEEAGFVASGRPIDAGAARPTSIVRRTFTLAAQTTSDDLQMILPAGFRPMKVRLYPSVTLGTSTLAVGVSGTTGKYRAAATVTAPTEALVPTAANVKLAAQETVLITIGVATLPGSGSLIVEFEGNYD